MPLHKPSRGLRLDPTMISAPLGDFRHTMHIGRGGDAFGDTSFLSTHGPSSPTAATAKVDGAAPFDRDEEDAPGELCHSDSLSSFTLDMDFDFGPSILGDVLGVMDGLAPDTKWPPAGEEGFDPEEKQRMDGLTVSSKNEVNERKEVRFVGGGVGAKGDEPPAEENGLRSKAPRPKVRFSDKRDEIIRRESEDDGQGFEAEHDDYGCASPYEGGRMNGGNFGHSPCQRPRGEAAPANYKADLPPSPASSLSSEYEGVSPLDRRRQEERHIETDSEDEEGEDSERGYTFEDEFDDEIGL